jgi:hypothetical protein
MSWSAAIIGGSSIIGGGLGYMGYRQQANTLGNMSKQQKKYGREARQDYKKALKNIKRNLAPWISAGEGSLEDLLRIQDQYESVIQDPNEYIQSPGYNWLQQQGIQAIDRGAAARGKLDSGQNQKDLMQFGQGLASQDYGNYLSRLENLMNQYTRTSQMGQNATSQRNQYEFGTAQGKANVRMQSLGQQGSTQLGLANAQTGLYNNLASIGSNAANQYMLYNYLNNLNQPQQGIQKPPLYGVSNLNQLGY